MAKKKKAAAPPRKPARATRPAPAPPVAPPKPAPPAAPPAPPPTAAPGDVRPPDAARAIDGPLEPATTPEPQAKKRKPVDVDPGEAAVYSAIPYDVDIQHEGRFYTVKTGRSVLPELGAAAAVGVDQASNGQLSDRGVVRIYPAGHERAGETEALIETAHQRAERFQSRNGRG